MAVSFIIELKIEYKLNDFNTCKVSYTTLTANCQCQLSDGHNVLIFT